MNHEIIAKLAKSNLFLDSVPQKFWFFLFKQKLNGNLANFFVTNEREKWLTWGPFLLLLTNLTFLLWLCPIFAPRIKDIPATAFQDLHSLEWIKLYNNLLTTLHYELMEPVLDTLMHIDIHSKYHTFFSVTRVSTKCDQVWCKTNCLFKRSQSFYTRALQNMMS